MKGRDVPAIIIQWLPQRKQFLARTRDFGLVLVLDELSQFILKCTTAKCPRECLGQWFLIDLFLMNRRHLSWKGVNWESGKRGTWISNLYPNLEIAGKPVQLKLNDVPAVVLNYRPNGPLRVFYSEHLGRIYASQDGEGTTGCDITALKPLEMVRLRLTPIRNGVHVHTHLPLHLGWWAEEVSRASHYRFPENIKQFTTDKLAEFALTDGYFEVSELGGRVFFAYPDCAGAVKGASRDDMMRMLNGAKSFTGIATPTFYGKNWERCQAVYVVPNFPQQNISGSPIALKTGGLLGPSEESAKVSERNEVSKQRPPQVSVAPMLSHTSGLGSATGPIQSTGKQATSATVMKAAEDETIDWDELEAELKAIDMVDDPEILPKNATKASDCDPAENPKPSVSAWEKVPMDERSSSESSDPARSGRSGGEREKDELIRSLVEDERVIQFLGSTRPDIIAQLFRIVKNWG